MNFQVVLISKLFFFPTKATRCFVTFSTFMANILRKFLELAFWSARYKLAHYVGPGPEQ